MRVSALFSLSLIALLGVAGCKAPSSAAYYNRGPESLLDVSSEVVTLGVSSPAEMTALKNWIQQDAPTRAELYCPDADMRCGEARQILGAHGIPVTSTPTGEFTVSLVYERILARDCKQKFVDNSSNPYNAYHPAFGCSVSANTVQHVSNKQEFVNPSLTDVPRATGAVDSYKRAYAPKPPPAPNSGIESSILQNVSTE